MYDEVWKPFLYEKLTKLENKHFFSVVLEKFWSTSRWWSHHITPLLQEEKFTESIGLCNARSCYHWRKNMVFHTNKIIIEQKNKYKYMIEINILSVFTCDKSGSSLILSRIPYAATKQLMPISIKATLKIALILLEFVVVLLISSFYISLFEFHCCRLENPSAQIYIIAQALWQHLYGLTFSYRIAQCTFLSIYLRLQISLFLLLLWSVSANVHDRRWINWLQIGQSVWKNVTKMKLRMVLWQSIKRTHNADWIQFKHKYFFGIFWT